LCTISQNQLRLLGYAFGYTDQVINPNHTPNIVPYIPNPAYQPTFLPNPEYIDEETTPEIDPSIPNPDHQPSILPNPEYIDEETTPGVEPTIDNPNYVSPNIQNPAYIPKYMDNPISNDIFIYSFLRTTIEKAVYEYRLKVKQKEADLIKNELLKSVDTVILE